jgi:dihydroorotate dehydrogenase
MGTVRPNQTQEELVADFVLAAQRSVETGVKVLEVNLSCPNIGNEGLICYLPKAREQILRAIRQAIGNLPLIVKIGYYHDLADLEDMARVVAEYADGVSAINTIQAAIYDSQGNQALPGPNRLRSGVCGAGIKWAGLEMVQKLHRIRQQKGYSYKIIGVGGVMTPQDYFDYRQAGADVVMSATGAMWNPYLAQEIKQIYTQQN